MTIQNLSSEPPGAKLRAYTTTFETTIAAQPQEPVAEFVPDTNDTITIDADIAEDGEHALSEQENAVIKIQAGVRGYLAREKVKHMKERASPNQGENK